MYYYLKGELILCKSNLCVIDCGGVGYQLTVSLNTSDKFLTKEGTTVKLYTHLAVREDGIELFGFSTLDERDTFHNLTSVSGIGPKVALSILSYFTPDKLALAICTEDVKSIAKTPGIGPKTAARIVLELRDKISKEMLTSDISAASSSATRSATSTKLTKNLSEATEALMVLGYDKNSILTALGGIDTESTPVSEIIRLALKKLSR